MKIPLPRLLLPAIILIAIGGLMIGFGSHRPIRVVRGVANACKSTPARQLTSGVVEFDQDGCDTATGLCVGSSLALDKNGIGTDTDDSLRYSLSKGQLKAFRSMADQLVTNSGGRCLGGQKIVQAELYLW